MNLQVGISMLGLLNSCEGNGECELFISVVYLLFISFVNSTNKWHFTGINWINIHTGSMQQLQQFYDHEGNFIVI